jgi:hypothetical protein
MVGYELFKRFAFEQLTSSIMKYGKFTINIFIGTIVSLLLVIGSFYLSLNGAHRLVDTSGKIESQIDTIQNKSNESISQTYNNRIDLKENQIQAINFNDNDGVLSARQRKVIIGLEADIKQLEVDRDNRIKESESKLKSKLTKQEDKIQQNSFAFAIMVFFLEFIILIGVAFNSYYIWNSYKEMKELMTSPKLRQLELNINLLKLYFQNGRKKESDSVIPTNKFKALVSNAKINCTLKDINNFIALCSELEIVTGAKKSKIYNMNFEKAKYLLQNQEL